MRDENVILDFHGRLVADSFVAFAMHRAARLDLALSILAAEADTISVSVGGDSDLIDMFDMACSLGPTDCLVLEVERRQASADNLQSRLQSRKLRTGS